MKTQEQINTENVAAERNPFYGRTFVTFKHTGERARIYSIYNNESLSLCVKGYTDTESDGTYHVSNFIQKEKV